MSSAERNTPQPVLLSIGIGLYLLWLLVLLLWIGAYLFQVSGLAPAIRGLSDSFLWATSILSTAAPCAAAVVRRRGISVFRVAPLVAWVLITPLTFILWPQSRPTDIFTLVSSFPSLFFEGLADATSSPIFLGVFIMGAGALTLIAGLYPRGPAWRRSAGTTQRN